MAAYFLCFVLYLWLKVVIKSWKMVWPNATDVAKWVILPRIKWGGGFIRSNRGKKKQSLGIDIHMARLAKNSIQHNKNRRGLHAERESFTVIEMRVSTGSSGFHSHARERMRVRHELVESTGLQLYYKERARDLTESGWEAMRHKLWHGHVATNVKNMNIIYARYILRIKKYMCIYIEQFVLLRKHLTQYMIPFELRSSIDYWKARDDVINFNTVFNPLHSSSLL